MGARDEIRNPGSRIPDTETLPHTWFTPEETFLFVQLPIYLYKLNSKLELFQDEMKMLPAFHLPDTTACTHAFPLPSLGHLWGDTFSQAELFSPPPFPWFTQIHGRPGRLPGTPQTSLTLTLGPYATTCTCHHPKW